MFLDGGTVNLTNVVISESYNNDIYVAHGYKGNLQYLITKKPDEAGRNSEGQATSALETSYGGGSDNAIAIANATLLGGDDANRSDRERQSVHSRY